MKTNNQLYFISPYRSDGMWVFDDERFSLIKEPLVAGIPEMIKYVTKEQKIENPKDGFNLIFSIEKFKGYLYVLDWERAEYNGNSYRLRDTDMGGWLCPALRFYYPDRVPTEIYFQVKGK